ncbi:universal stress protein [Lacipirellula limnantheis]|uniref:Universal stress protein family protein n=1 Tax=Lacipirellula limnantheis TaxID=2528024 RepID=A0A517U3H0_9BACT|nr:universal stress protein [Lacipirellula limnantheis]QDT75172.1 Universal stress protein family protein [Lacipirellula limnantheis]
MTSSIDLLPRKTCHAGARVQRVLAPIDFDEESRRSRLTAIELAAQWGAKVTLLHVSQRAPLAQPCTGLDAIGLLHRVLRTPAGPMASFSEQELQLRRLEQSAIRRMKNDVPQYLVGKVEFTFAWRAGNVAEEIVAYAKEQACDVIVLGKNECSRPWRLSRGVTRRVIQTATCQVLVAYPSGQASVGDPKLTVTAS